ncbi:putative disease resistance protein RGA3 [Prunus dulcis]|uniref:putative disease resistance protein RGA3 n=1 Tax=Prunus dulcis TaxID=3755 RepID=UPI00148265D3|nr:putative disease resistance protein RGA3 [Prunus dulcis]
MAVESVLTFATEGILMKLISLAAQEISLAWGFKAELNRLRKTLSTIEGYLADVAQGPQGRSKSVEDWVTNLKRLAQDADDVLDEFNYELLRRKVEIRNHMKKKVLNFFSLSNPVAFRLKIAHKIQKINASLVNLKSEAPIIGLVSKKTDAAPQGIRGRIQTDSLLEKDGIIVGREEVVSNIVTTLTNSNINQENIAVMAIVGMAGLGKTTLAKSVYNDNSVINYFEKRIWVCVSEPFNINVILICMLESLNPSKATVRENQDALLKYLEEELRAKRYLLVLDDVWNEDSEKWESLMSYLSKLNSDLGSKIIVTTRSVKIASITETLPRPKLELLSTDECWSILKHATCSDGSSDIPLHLERIGREIAKNCEGLPLMAKVLGGILCSKKTPAEWSEVKDNRIWDLPKAEDRIMSVLKLSFDNLESPALKQCFSYCSVFMKEAKMERNDLIQLWMAQGFLHPSPEKSNLEMEDIGKEYFDILFQRSLFQDARLDYAGIIKYKMHDLIHDLAERVSETGSMMRDFHEDEDVATPIIERIPEGSSGKLRSLFSNAEALPGNMLPWFKALRVLKLYGANIVELPSSIKKLKHLRYLDISSTWISRLPNSIGKLYNLQTLRATDCLIVEFPKEVQNLINLRHVYCEKETKFPVGVLGRLTSLRKLPCSYEDSEVMGREIEELAVLNQLKGKLIICNLEHVRNGDEARVAKLKDKKNVRDLKFVWSEDRSITNNNNEEDVLEGLQPHSELERLEIRYFMGTKFPSWMIKLENLKEIKLLGCNRCEKVPTLGHLPHLTVVWIGEMDNLKCVGEEIYGNVGFPALKELYICYCNELIEWMDAPEQVMVFPCLEKLEMWKCPKLRKAPSHLPSLKELVVFYCSSLQSIPDLNLFTSLRELRIEYCERLESLVSSGPFNVVELLTITGCSGLQSISDLNIFTSLRELRIEDCERLESLVSSGPVNVVELLTITCCCGLQSIPDLNLFTSLRELRIEYCKRLESLVSSGPVNVVELMTITGCSGLQSIPDLNLFTSLRELRIKDCERLESLVFSGPVNVVELLTITGCSGLQSIPDLNLFTSLRELSIEYCERLESLVSSEPVSVVELKIRNAPNLESQSLDNLTSLSLLVIGNCGKLKYPPTGLHCCASLKTLKLGRFWEELDSFPDFHLGTGSSQLQKLELNGWPKLKSLPQQIQDFTSLTSLVICEFDGVEALEDWLGTLSFQGNASRYLWILYHHLVRGPEGVGRERDFDI